MSTLVAYCNDGDLTAVCNDVNATCGLKQYQVLLIIDISVLSYQHMFHVFIGQQWINGCKHQGPC